MPPKQLTYDEFAHIMKVYGENAVSDLIAKYDLPLKESSQLMSAYYGSKEACKAASNKLKSMEMNVRQRSIMCAMVMEINKNPNLTLDDLLDTASPNAIERKKNAGAEALKLFDDEVAFNKAFTEGCKKISNMIAKACKTFDGFNDNTIKQIEKYKLFFEGLFDAHNQVFAQEKYHKGVPVEQYIDTFNEIQAYSRLGTVSSDIADRVEKYSHPDPNSRKCASKLISSTISSKAWADNKVKRLASGHLDILDDPDTTTWLVATTYESNDPNIYSQDNPPKGVLSALDEEDLLALALTTDPNTQFSVDVSFDKNNNASFKYTLNGIDLQAQTPLSQIPKDTIDTVKQFAKKVRKDMELNYSLSVNNNVDTDTSNAIEIMDDNKSRGIFRKDSVYDVSAEMKNTFQKLNQKYPDLAPFLKYKDTGKDASDIAMGAYMNSAYYNKEAYSGNLNFYTETIKFQLEDFANDMLDLTPNQVSDFVNKMSSREDIDKVMPDIIQTIQNRTAMLRSEEQGYGAAKNDNLSNKNIAMHNFAVYLNQREVFPESSPMFIKSGDEAPVSGVFTKAAAGYNIANTPSKIKELSNLETSPLNTPSGIEALAEFQIFMYVTAGHLSFPWQNINLTEEEGEVVGMTLTDSEKTGAFSPLKSNDEMDPLIISEGTAHNIEKMTKENFDKVFLGLDISKEGKEAAWGRIQKLQEMIKTPSDKLEHGKMHIVKKGEWGNYNLQQLCDEHDKINKELESNEIRETQSIFYGAAHLSGMLEVPHPTTEKANVNKHVAHTSDTIDSLKALLKEHKSNKLLFRGSEQYDNMGKAIEAAIENANAVKLNASPENLEEYKASMQYIKTAVSKYTDLHANEANPGSNTRKRMGVAAHILEFADKESKYLSEQATARHIEATENDVKDWEATRYSDKVEALREATKNLDGTAKEFGDRAVAGMYNLVNLMNGKSSMELLTDDEVELAKESMAAVTAYAMMSQFRFGLGDMNKPTLFEAGADSVATVSARIKDVRESDVFKKTFGDEPTTAPISQFLKKDTYKDMSNKLVNAKIDEMEARKKAKESQNVKQNESPRPEKNKEERKDVSKQTTTL